MTQDCKRFDIVCRGDTDEDIEDALDEAVRRIKEGSVMGADKNDTSGFYFAVIDEVPRGDWPAN